MKLIPEVSDHGSGNQLASGTSSIDYHFDWRPTGDNSPVQYVLNFGEFHSDVNLTYS